MVFIPPEDFVPTLPHGISFAAAFCTDERDRPLLLTSVHRPGDYQYPGGLLDPGEDPWGCVLRETAEELGFVPASLRGPRLLVVSFTPPRAPWPWKLGVVFDGGRLTAAELARITLDPQEHSGHAVRSVDEWARLVTAPRLGLLRASLAARRSGAAAYLPAS
ncbi:NUDIX domain-containing protein [Kitasatospora sp. NPDC054939]